MAGNKKPSKSKPRKPLTSNTPIVFGISQREKDMIKKIPYESLAAFEENKGNATDWYNLGFRLHVGLNIAKDIYTEEALAGMKESISAIETMRLNHLADDSKAWEATKEQIDLITMGLEATDTMQDQTLRRDQLTAHRLAKVQMNKLADGSQLTTD